MNSSVLTSEHILFFRGTSWDRDLSPREMQETLDATMEWFGRLREAGRVRAAQPLFESGRVVSGKDGAVVSDGPFAEAKETIGGYLIVQVGSFEEAVAIARTWPLLEHGASVEVRPVAPECPNFQRIRDGAV